MASWNARIGLLEDERGRDLPTLASGPLRLRLKALERQGGLPVAGSPRESSSARMVSSAE